MTPACPYCQPNLATSKLRITSVVRFGSFKRSSDLAWVQRYRCGGCRRTFSTASSHPCFKQKRRDLNPMVFQEFASGVSQRRMAWLLGVNRKTIVRKFRFLGLWADRALNYFGASKPVINEMQFDDLETFEHSKLKPLSVVMAVDAKTREILGFEVARMPAKGLLVARSLKKYGPRADERKAARQRLFSNIKSRIHPNAIIRSDQNPHYKADVLQHFPEAVHLGYPGRRGCVVGQGELKAGGYDPLFSLNHTFAMLRANINRLFRRTWNTTKKPEELTLHLALYSLYHNHVVLQ